MQAVTGVIWDGGSDRKHVPCSATPWFVIFWLSAAAAVLKDVSVACCKVSPQEAKQTKHDTLQSLGRGVGMWH
jgi:hypothetical protein